MYPRSATAPPTLPHVEAQKAAYDARGARAPLAPDAAGRRVYRLRPSAGPRAGRGRLRSDLDAERLAAVEEASGRCLVLASAGTGKTRVIVAKLAHLAETGV